MSRGIFLCFLCIFSLGGGHLSFGKNEPQTQSVDALADAIVEASAIPEIVAYMSDKNLINPRIHSLELNNPKLEKFLRLFYIDVPENEVLAYIKTYWSRNLDIQYGSDILNFLHSPSGRKIVEAERSAFSKEKLPQLEGFIKENGKGFSGLDFKNLEEKAIIMRLLGIHVLTTHPPEIEILFFVAGHAAIEKMNQELKQGKLGVDFSEMLGRASAYENREKERIRVGKSASWARFTFEPFDKKILQEALAFSDTEAGEHYKEMMIRSLATAIGYHVNMSYQFLKEFNRND